MNKTFHLGNLTRDPETRFTKDGKSITNFAIAVNGYKDKVNYFDITAFDKTAELVAKYKKKGDTVIVEGRLETDSWEDATTKQKRYKTYIVAENVNFVGGAKNSEGESSAPARSAKSTGNSRQPVPVADDFDSDLPF